MNTPIQFDDEERSNTARRTVGSKEPIAQRTYTPTQAVFSKSAGCFHWTPEGRRLYDFSSGVLVTNLGHNPRRWFKRFFDYLGWDQTVLSGAGEFASAAPMNAYNAVTPVEAAAVDRLVQSVQSRPGGRRLNSVMWSASGSEAIQKALWACLHRDEKRDIILATRYGFHGKKGLAGAVTGCETDHDRDPRVRFISFPMAEVDDLSKYDDTFAPNFYQSELESLWKELGPRINCLITEPYLGGGGSYHPPAAYQQLLQSFCRKHDILFILDEVQANFGRTGPLYAFERYGIEPDFICLGKGLGNGIPVSAVVGRGDVMSSLAYGEASDTWSANPVSCAAVLATLDEFETTDVLERAREISRIFFRGLARLKETSLVTKVRGEGMVFGIECGPAARLTAAQIANKVVETCYLGKPGADGIHFLGPLAGCVLRVSPPLTMTTDEAEASLELLFSLVSELARKLPSDDQGSHYKQGAAIA
jgi:4-aminobutyrate aminotransferase-like enzyme